MNPRKQYNPIVILNSTINMVDINFATAWMSDRIQEWRGAAEKNCPRAVSQMVVTGFHGLNEANKNAEYFRMGEECDLWIPDSIAPILIARMRGMKNVSRTPGVELMDAFFALAEEKGYSSFFYGDTEATLSKMRENLQKRYPALKIAGMLSPPFHAVDEEEVQKHIRMINDAAPDILWVGLGLPKQDIWIYRRKGDLKVPVAVGVGAAFGFLAGTVRRAPKIWCRAGLEWLYLVIKKPRRTLKRVVVNGSEFIWAICKEEYKRKRKR